MKRFCAVFLGAFAGYAFWLSPSLAPYRDSGEMAASAWTLGVSHPTSYPLYILLGRLACALPLGDPAHRLALLSALFAALAVAALFELCARRYGLAAGAAAAVLLAFNPIFCSIAVVQEMYSLWVLLAVLSLAIALKLHDRFDDRLWLAFCLFYGLALGNRLDLLLWAPGLLWLALPGSKTATPGLWAAFAFVGIPAVMAAAGSNTPIVFLIVGTAFWLRARRPVSFDALAAAFALLGFAVYLYLPLRSARGPWLDWNHPAVAANFAESLLRTKYGGTLDLLSKSYKTGELFGDNMVLWGRHLWSSFWAAGLFCAAAGFGAQARRTPRRALGLAALFFWYGPFFLFLANMPPNPHAAAIVEPHYLLADVILAVWAAEGVSLLAGRPLWQAAALAALAAAPWTLGLRARADRRWHLYDYDYAKNVLRSAPPGAAVVAKKDVQLYTLWYFQAARGLRPDVRTLAQGLAGSAWYQADWRRRNPDLYVGELSDGPGWRRAAAADAPLLATPDAELPPALAGVIKPSGLLVSLAPPAPGFGDALWSLMPMRGRYSYEDSVDFFTSDLVDAYAAGLFRRGSALAASGQPGASAVLQHAWALHWLFPDPAAFLGYLAYQSGDFAGASRYYGLAVDLSQRLLALADAYRALPDVRDAIRKGGADDLTQLGVAFEKLGKPDAARDCYERSIALYPTAQAHYDYAVLYWRRDPAVAQRELEAALQVDPSRSDVARYLAVLRSRASAAGTR